MHSLDLFLVQYGLAAIFIILLIKTIGIQIPIPADLIILTAAARVAQGKLNGWQTFIAILIALVIGGLIQFLLARGPGRGFLYRFGRYIGLTSPRLDAALCQGQKRWCAQHQYCHSGTRRARRSRCCLRSGKYALENLPTRAGGRKCLIPRTPLFSRLSWRISFLYYWTCATITCESSACISVVVNYICSLGRSSKTSKDSATRCGGDFTRTMA